MKELMEIIAKTLSKVVDRPARECSIFLCRNCMTFSYKGERYIITLNKADEYVQNHNVDSNPSLKGNVYARAN